MERIRAEEGVDVRPLTNLDPAEQPGKEKKHRRETHLRGRGYGGLVKNSFGGNQNWFDTERRLSKEFQMHFYGCGLIAMADLFLYLTGQTNGMEKKDYMLYVYRMRRMYGKMIIPGMGMPSPWVVFMVRKFMRLHNLPYKVSWAVNNGKILEKIEEMLERGLPVILSVGPDYRFFLKKRGISFYRRKTEEGRDIYTVASPDVKGHFVTCTGVVREEGEGGAQRVFLEISSWGKKYFIDFAEFRRYQKMYPVFPIRSIHSNILYIH